MDWEKLWAEGPREPDALEGNPDYAEMVRRVRNILTSWEVLTTSGGIRLDEFLEESILLSCEIANVVQRDLDIGNFHVDGNGLVRFDPPQEELY